MTESFKDEWLLRALISQKLLDEAAVASLRAGNHPYASTEIIRRGLLTEAALGLAVLKQYGVSAAQPAAADLGKLALSLIPERLCRKHSFIPFREAEGRVDLLMANPIDMIALDDAATVSGRKPVAFFGLPDKIVELIARAYASDAAIFDLLKKFPDEEEVEFLDAAPESRETATEIAAPVVRLTDGLIAQGIRMKASDIHIEQEEFATMVRFRIDGDLRTILTLPKHIGEGPLVSRIKIMSNLDVADRRRPQDGRAKLLVGKREFGLRVSTIPTAFGEKAVLRILDPRQAQVPLVTLGYRPEALERLLRLSHSEKGMLLVTGATGSGKTTTLYSILNELKSAKINVVTVEDPIEYRLGGINQVQVNEKAGLTFAAVLRSVLRQDPDVLLVGEIRDKETAEIALQAAMTGHMVFSTLHTNNAIATVDRLLDMGIERFKLAPALVGIVSQRLVRRLCPDCRIEEAPAPLMADLMRKWRLPVRQYAGKGCEKCLFSGTLGRMAITEILDLSHDAARELVASEIDTAALRRECLKLNCFLTLEQDALWHLSEGDISVEEALGLLRAPQTSSAYPDGAPEPSAARAAGGTRILVVDDIEANRLLVRNTLSTEGYTLTEAATGKEALAMILNDKPDLLLLDLQMPGMDGFAVLKAVRGRMGFVELPIMILTALGEVESQTVALEIGADDYMTKPFSPILLRARVRALLRRADYRPGAQSRVAVSV